MSLLLHVHAATDVGCVRQRNEDALCIGERPVYGELAWRGSWTLPKEEPLVVAVVDGMGGHRGGAEASRIVTQQIARITANLEPSIDRACDWMSSINAQLFAAANADPELCAMGATVALLWFGREGGLSINVGDAKIFRLQDGYLQQRSEDHIVGVPGGARTLLQAIGGSSTLLPVKPSVQMESIRAGRKYLLCSDGLTDEVEIETMENLMQQTSDQALHTMLEVARKAGGRDNISIIIAEFVEELTS